MAAGSSPSAGKPASSSKPTIRGSHREYEQDPGEEGHRPWSLSEAEVEGRAQAWELFDFFRKRVPGFAQARMGFSGPCVGVRSSRQIVGIHKIAVDELFQRRRYPDLISHCGYPVDIHSPDGAGTEHRHFPYGAYYNVPLRAMLPREIGNLAAAGRCISADFEAQAFLRLSPPRGGPGTRGGSRRAKRRGRGPLRRRGSARSAGPSGSRGLPERRKRAGQS
jgi:hypothetical protein